MEQGWAGPAVSKSNGKPDPIAAAIAATEAPVEVKMHQINLTLGTTKRPVVLLVPEDMQPLEVFDLVSWLTNCADGQGLSASLAQARGPQLVRAASIPHGLPRPS